MMYVEIFNGIIEYYEPKIMCGGLEDIIFNESSYVPEINSLARISLARIYPDCYWMVLEWSVNGKYKYSMVWFGLERHSLKILFDTILFIRAVRKCIGLTVLPFGWCWNEWNGSGDMQGICCMGDYVDERRLDSWFSLSRGAWSPFSSRLLLDSVEMKQEYIPQEYGLQNGFVRERFSLLFSDFIWTQHSRQYFKNRTYWDYAVILNEAHPDCYWIVLKWVELYIESNADIQKFVKAFFYQRRLILVLELVLVILLVANIIIRVVSRIMAVIGWSWNDSRSRYRSSPMVGWLGA